MPSSDPVKRRAHKRAEGERRREKVKAWVRSIKEINPCTDCGLRYPYYVMHFDHLPGHEKVAQVSELLHGNFSQAKLLEEIHKCEVVCANCHAERTHGRKHGTHSDAMAGLATIRVPPLPLGSAKSTPGPYRSSGRELDSFAKPGDSD